MSATPPMRTPPGATEGRCGSCGKRIFWVVNVETGKSVPLDPAPPVYALRWLPSERPGEQPRPIWGRTTVASPAFTSHFVTCADPRPFSGRNRVIPVHTPPAACPLPVAEPRT